MFTFELDEINIIWVSDVVIIYLWGNYITSDNPRVFILHIVNVLNVGIQFGSSLILTRMGYYSLGFRVPDFIT